MKYATLFYHAKNERVTYEWQGDPLAPIQLGEKYFFCKRKGIPLPHPWSLKIIREDKRCISPKAIAVRTDIQPLWWMAVAIQYELEDTLTRINWAILGLTWRMGLLDLEPGMMPHWGRFRLSGVRDRLKARVKPRLR